MIIFSVFSVPDEEPTGPRFVEAPQSQTVDESRPVKFSCSFDEVDRGIFIIAI